MANPSTVPAKAHDIVNRMFDRYQPSDFREVESALTGLVAGKYGKAITPGSNQPGVQGLWGDLIQLCETAQTGSNA